MSILDMEFPRETEIKIIMSQLCKELNQSGLIRYMYCEFYNPVIANRTLEKTTYDPNKKWYLWVHKSFDLEGDVYQLFFFPTINLGPEFDKYSLNRALYKINENINCRISLDDLLKEYFDINNIVFI